MFGYTKGAFTGAVKNRDGLFEAAHGGTLFLDEIGDMPLNLQARILRVIQDGEIKPLGANTSRQVDVRLVSATHRHLKEMVAENEEGTAVTVHHDPDAPGSAVLFTGAQASVWEAVFASVLIVVGWGVLLFW